MIVASGSKSRSPLFLLVESPNMAKVERTVTPLVAAVWLVVLACLALTAVDNFRLRSEVTALSNELERAKEVPLGPAPGPITANDAQKGEVLVDDGATEDTTIVLVASFNCVFSKQTMGVWRNLAAELPKARFVLLRVDARPTDGSDGGKYGHETFSFPGRPDLRWQVPSESTVAAYRLGNVPQTIVERRGQILYVRTGALKPADVGRIRKAAL